MKDKNLKEVTVVLNEQELRDIGSALSFSLRCLDILPEAYKRQAYLLHHVNETLKSMQP